jgi:hypothetical protein
MISSTACYVRKPGLQTRAIPQWGNLLMYIPAQRGFHWLNLNAWLIFELCDGRDEVQLRSAYQAAVKSKLPAGEAERHLRDGLTLLESIGAIVRETKKGDSDARSAQESDSAM